MSKNYLFAFSRYSTKTEIFRVYERPVRYKNDNGHLFDRFAGCSIFFVLQDYYVPKRKPKTRVRHVAQCIWEIDAILKKKVLVNSEASAQKTITGR